MLRFYQFYTDILTNSSRADVLHFLATAPITTTQQALTALGSPLLTLAPNLPSIVIILKIYVYHLHLTI